jgi:hypothetical protein
MTHLFGSEITVDPGDVVDREHVGFLVGELADIRDGLEELQARFERVMQDVRALPGGELRWQRIDAYPGTRLDRDMGAGKSAVDWIEEVGTFLEQLADADREATHRFRPCEACGGSPDIHNANRGPDFIGHEYR